MSWLSELDMTIIKQALVYTRSSWEEWHKQGIFPDGWDEGSVLLMLDQLKSVSEKWDSLFSKEEHELPDNILSFPRGEE